MNPLQTLCCHHSSPPAVRIRCRSYCFAISPEKSFQLALTHLRSLRRCLSSNTAAPRVDRKSHSRAPRGLGGNARALQIEPPTWCGVRLRPKVHALLSRNAVNLDVEIAWPSRDTYKNPCW